MGLRCQAWLTGEIARSFANRSLSKLNDLRVIRRSLGGRGRARTGGLLVANASARILYFGESAGLQSREIHPRTHGFSHGTSLSSLADRGDSATICEPRAKQAQ